MPYLRSFAFRFLLLMLCVPGLAWASPTALSVELRGRTELITITVPVTGKANVFTLANPDRIVVDLPSVPSREALKLPVNYKGRLIKQLRAGQFDPETTRLVFELAVRPNPLRTSTQSKHGQTVITLEIGGAGGSAKVEKPQEKKEPRPTIVIDAGHGGQDPGTMGPAGAHEKDVVLNYARALRRELLATGKYRVVMTRDDDHFILLRERVAIARRAKADMFVSLHADSAPERSARGLSVYTLSEKASDAESAALAERENKVDVLSGMDLSGESKDVADILISLAQRDTNNRSAMVAGKLVTTMDDERVQLLPNSHRFAGFAVLKAPDIPSVLVEIGFLSHPQEEQQLQEKAYRQKIVQALAQGIDGFFSAKQQLAQRAS